MGWASAGSTIFNPTIRALIDAKADDAVVFQVARDLIANLRENDWDTEDESLEEFRANPAVVRAFAEFGIRIRHTSIEKLSTMELDLMRETFLGTTPGVWSVQNGQHVYIDEGDGPSYHATLDGLSETDARFLIRAHEMVPKMLNEIQRLKLKLAQEHDNYSETTS